MALNTDTSFVGK